jgi:hypothetical protein
MNVLDIERISSAMAIVKRQTGNVVNFTSILPDYVIAGEISPRIILRECIVDLTVYHKIFFIHYLQLFTAE